MKEWVTIRDFNGIKYVTFTNTPITDELFLKYKQDYVHMFIDRNPKKVIFDSTEMEFIPIKYVFYQILFMIEMEDIHREFLKCYSVVITSNIIRKLLEFAYKIKPPVCRNNSISSNIEEALEYVNKI